MICFRELKPGNILLGDQGHATLTYFCQINQVNDYLDFEAMHNLYVAPGKFAEICLIVQSLHIILELDNFSLLKGKYNIVHISDA